jgi:dehydrogenase/reductase SDR family member 12
MSRSLEGKTAIVTGANQGLGYQTSLELASKGATLFMVCRNPERGAAAVEAIIKQTNNNNVHLKICDVSSLSSIQSLADDLKASKTPIHILVNNAGVMVHDKVISGDGMEVNFATNTLGPLALTRALEDLLVLGSMSSANNNSNNGSRVIFVSSGGMLTENLVIDDLQCDKMSKFDGLIQYARDKRRQVAITEALAAEYRQSGKNISVYAMHPGWTETDGVKTSIPGFYSTFKNKLRNLQQGADTIVWLCLEDAEKLKPGELYLDRQVQSKHLSLAWGSRYSDHDRTKLMEKLDAMIKV